MKSSVKQQFIDRLQQLRNYVVADVALISGKPLEIKSDEKEEQEESEKEEVRPIRNTSKFQTYLIIVSSNNEIKVTVHKQKMLHLHQ